MLAKEKAYLVAWPIFGTSNQLLAALTLLAISIWLRQTGKRAVYAFVPMVFMLVVTLWSLVNLIKPLIVSLPAIFRGEVVKIDIIIAGICGLVLLLLSLLLIKETIKTLLLNRNNAEKGS
jgi:carbon starvation protein